jgi:RHS repeat-associated protein
MSSSITKQSRARIVLLALLTASACFGGLQLLILTPPAAPPAVSGDYNLDGVASADDLTALTMAIHDLPAWIDATGGSLADLLAVGDYDGDGAITLSDCDQFVAHVIVQNAPPQQPLSFPMGGMQMLAMGDPLGTVDFDTDTDHTNPIQHGESKVVLLDRNDTEELLDASGAARCICQNGDDDDNDLVSDWSDGDVAPVYESDLVALAIEIRPDPSIVSVWDPIKYSVSQITSIPAGSGSLRLWRSRERINAVSFDTEYEHYYAVHGDLNFDGQVDFDDITPYVAALGNVEPFYNAQQAAGNIPQHIPLWFVVDIADINNDRVSDYDDTPAFLDLLDIAPAEQPRVPVWLIAEAEPVAPVEFSDTLTIRAFADTNLDTVLESQDDIYLSMRRCDGPLNCDNDNIPNDCEADDCNGNSVSDDCDLLSGDSTDTLLPGTPDECAFGPVDVDVDSDNDDASWMPGRTQAEELIEDDPTQTGKIVFFNGDDDDLDGTRDYDQTTSVVMEDDLVPIVCGLSFGDYLAPGDTVHYQLRVEGDASNRVRFWPTRERGNPFTDTIDPAYGPTDMLTFVARILGDMNGSHTLDAGDLTAFDLATTDLATYQSTYPGIDPSVIGDLNADGWLDGTDRALLDDAIQGGTISMAPHVLWLECHVSAAHLADEMQLPPDTELRVTLQVDPDGQGLAPNDPADTVRLHIWDNYSFWCGSDLTDWPEGRMAYYGLPPGQNVTASAPVPSPSSFEPPFQSRCWNDRNWRDDPPKTLEPGFGANLDVNLGPGPSDFPPLSNDPATSTSPLVPADSAYSGESDRFAERTVVHGTLDAVTGVPLISATDFELPFGGAVFRHIRTFSERTGPFQTANRDSGCSGGGNGCLFENPLGEWWDWNGLNWMMSENPLFLIDANWRNVVTPRPKRCYFVVDAHHAIPFEWVGAPKNEYVAPPWFDARLTYDDDDSDGQIDTFYVWLHRNSVKYTIKPIYEDLWVEKNQYTGEWVHAHEHPDDGGMGMPYQGLVTQIEDRYGNTVELSYCDFRQFPCTPDRWPLDPETDCQAYCQTCEQKGMLRSIRLRSADGAVVWTLLYTYRGFAGADRPGSVHPHYESGGLDGFAFEQESVQQAMLHSIHVYEGDKDLKGYGCSVIPANHFWMLPQFQAYDQIDVEAEGYVPSGWVTQARYMYQEPNEVLRWEPFGQDWEIWDDARRYPTSGNFIDIGYVLLKSHVTHKTGQQEVTERTIYLYNINGPLAMDHEREFLNLKQIIDEPLIAQYVSEHPPDGPYPENSLLYESVTPARLRLSRPRDEWSNWYGAKDELAAFVGLPIGNSTIIQRTQRLTLHDADDDSIQQFMMHNLISTGDSSYQFNIHRHPSVYHFPYRLASDIATIPEFMTFEDSDFSDVRFATIVDELDNSTSYNPSSLTGIITRRVIEMNAAGLVLRDRTYRIENGDTQLETQIGFAESLKYDCKGRIVERRTTGWSVAEGLGISDLQGLIYVNKYEDNACGGAPSDPSCNCGTGWPANIDQPVGELVATGIKQGTSGQVYYTSAVTRHPVKRDLIASQIVFPTPQTDYTSTDGQLTEYEYELTGTSETPAFERTITRKIIRRAATPFTAGGEAHHSTEETLFNANGAVEWMRWGSEAASSPGTFAEVFISHAKRDAQGRVLLEVFDAQDNPPDQAYTLPAGWTRQSSTAPLDLRTVYTYDYPFGLSTVTKPNGATQHFLYDVQGSDIYQWQYYIGSDGSELLEPVTVRFFSGPGLASTKQLTGPPLAGPPAVMDLNNLPAGWEVLNDGSVEYDESGRPTTLTKATGDGSESVSAQIYYHATGVPAAVYEPDGTITRFTYTKRGHLSKTYRGTDDEHDYWGTADDPSDPSTWTDNLVLIEKRTYGEGVNDAEQLITVRRYRNRPDDQYFQCDPDVDPTCSENNEDDIGFRTEHFYDWRMREAWVVRFDEDGNITNNSLTWYDNLNRPLLAVEYGPTVPSGIDPTAIVAGESSDAIVETSLQAILAAISTNAPLSMVRTLYDERGSVHETRSYNCGDPSGAYTVTRRYYDFGERVAEVHSSNSPVVRYVYDSRKRLVSQSELQSGMELSRTETTYDEDDQAIVITSYVRNHDGTGDILDSQNSIITYTHKWYDDAGRTIAVVDFGTNTPTFENSLDAPAYVSDPAPVTTDANGNITSCGCAQAVPYGTVQCFSYDEAGRQRDAVSADGVITRSEYDDLDRLILTTENAGDRDNDGLQRYTAYKFDANGRLEAMAAVMPEHFQGSAATWENINWAAPISDTTIQITRFTYDAEVFPAAWDATWDTAGTGGWIITTPGGWNPVSGNNSWISRVEYPDGDALAFTYYSDGSVASRADSKGNVFIYSYDEQGQLSTVLIDDSIYYPGNGLQLPANRIHKIVYTYETNGLVDTVTAYTHDAGGNEVQVSTSDFGYDAQQNLTSELQQHFSQAAQTTQYGWEYLAHDVGNSSRLRTITYPVTGNVLTLDYAGLRPTGVTKIRRNATEVLAEFGYAGDGMRVSQTRGSNVVTQSFGLGGGGYNNLDTFGRVKTLQWQLPTTGYHYQYEYGYDKAGNRTHAKVAQIAHPGVQHDNEHSWAYTYDALQRLINADMGQLNAQFVVETTVGVRSDHLAWTMDTLGNWVGDAAGTTPGFNRTINTDGDALIDFTYDIDHAVDTANQLDSVAFDDGSGAVNTVYLQDLNGNLVYDGRLFYQYDAFNRLVSVHEAGSVDPETAFDDDPNHDTYGQLINDANLGPLLAAFTYDGMGRLLQTYRADVSGRSAIEQYYYDGDRRIIEEETKSSGTPITREYVYGPGYVDEVICVTEQQSPPAGPSLTAYVLQDANYNVVALVDTAGGLLRQYNWDPYGQLVAKEHNPAAPLLPTTRLGHQGLFFERFHVDAGDNVLDSGQTLGTFDAVTGRGPAGLFYNRNRWYSPSLGRFTSRDINATSAPIDTAMRMNGDSARILVGTFDYYSHYRDGASLYGYLGSNPLNGLDPTGLFDYFEEVDSIIMQMAGEKAAAAHHAMATLKNMAQTVAISAIQVTLAAIFPPYGMYLSVQGAAFAIESMVYDGVNWNNSALLAASAVGVKASYGPTVATTRNALNRISAGIRGGYRAVGRRYASLRMSRSGFSSYRPRSAAREYTFYARKPGSGKAGRTMSYDDALDALRYGEDVVAANEKTARMLARELGSGPPVFDAGHHGGLPHYHAADAFGNRMPGIGHIFF